MCRRIELTPDMKELVETQIHEIERFEPVPYACQDDVITPLPLEEVGHIYITPDEEDTIIRRQLGTSIKDE